MWTLRTRIPDIADTENTRKTANYRDTADTGNTRDTADTGNTMQRHCGHVDVSIPNL